MTGFFSHCNSQYCRYAFMTINSTSAPWSCDCSCSESLLYILQSAPIVDTILEDLLILVISHTTKLQIWIWWSLKHTLNILGCCIECKILSIGLGAIFETWSTSKKWSYLWHLLMDFNEWGVKMCRNKLYTLWQPSFPPKGCVFWDLLSWSYCLEFMLSSMDTCLYLH